jgi:hypothetical protein
VVAVVPEAEVTVAVTVAGEGDAGGDRRRCKRGERGDEESTHGRGAFRLAPTHSLRNCDLLVKLSERARLPCCVA